MSQCAVAITEKITDRASRNYGRTCVVVVPIGRFMVRDPKKVRVFLGCFKSSVAARQRAAEINCEGGASSRKRRVAAKLAAKAKKAPRKPRRPVAKSRRRR